MKEDPRYIKPWDAPKRRLLPCPFCGSRDIMLDIQRTKHPDRDIESYIVRCLGDGCYVSMPTSTCFKTSAIIKWNTRFEPHDRHTSFVGFVSERKGHPPVNGNAAHYVNKKTKCRRW